MHQPIAPHRRSAPISTTTGHKVRPDRTTSRNSYKYRRLGDT